MKVNKAGVPTAIEIQDKGLLLAVHLYNDMVLDWIKQIKFKDTFKEVNKIDFKINPKATEILNSAMLVSYLQGAYRVKQEVAYQLEKQKVLKFADYTGDFDFAHSTFQEAIDWLLKKNIISGSEFKQVSSMLKQISFSISGIEQKEVMAAVRDSMANAMRDGIPYRQWAKNVDEVFSNYGITPISPHHLETVYRTNLMSVYNIAKYEQTQLDDNTTGYEYVAVMDDRTRDEHAAMNGFIAAKDDPVWDTWWPPPPDSPYNCRCSIIPVTDYYMARNNLQYNDNLPNGVEAKSGGRVPSLENFYRDIRTA